MLSVPRDVLLVPASASLTTLETPTLPVDLNVSSMLTVHQANSAEISIVLIPVLGCVESTLTARLPITSQYVSVTRDTLVTPSCPAGDLRHLLLVTDD